MKVLASFESQQIELEFIRWRHHLMAQYIICNYLGSYKMQLSPATVKIFCHTVHHAVKSRVVDRGKGCGSYLVYTIRDSCYHREKGAEKT